MFSKKTEYALRATIYIAKHSTEEKKLSIVDISKAINSPQSFTAKILQVLTKKKLIHSLPGPNGGFYITDPTLQAPISCIVDAMGENEVLDKCVLGLKKCSSVNPCPLHEQYKKVKLQLKEIFEEKSIGKLAKELKNNKSLQY